MKFLEKYEKRITNIELVRIIAMFLIIMSHYKGYSGFEVSDFNNIINKTFLNTFFNFGTLGVSLFIIISGYFYDKNKITIYKLIKLLLQIFVYSILGLLIGIILKSDQFTIKNIVKSIMPTTFGLYWFASCYVLIYLFSPFLKRIIDKFNKKDLKIMLSLMIIIWSFVTMIPGARTFWNEFIWLIVIYLLGAYIKKYNINIMKNNKHRLILILIIIILLSIIIMSIEAIALKIPILEEFVKYFNNIQSPFILILTILIFNVFKNLNIKNNKSINAIASSTFGIYLIHENIFLRNVIWKNIVGAENYINSPLLIINAIIGVMGVFTVCSIIAFVIDNYIIKNIMKVIEKIVYRIEKQKTFIKVKTKVLNFYNN